LEGKVVDDNDQRRIHKDAEAFVACLSDGPLKSSAFNAVLWEIRRQGGRNLRYMKCLENQVSLLLAALLATLALASLTFHWPLIASAIIALLIDVGILFLLLIVGWHSDCRRNFWSLMPHRFPALIVTALALAGLLLAFANMYIESKGVCPSGHCGPRLNLTGHASTSIDPNHTAKASFMADVDVTTTPTDVQPLSIGDAVYFSTVTMTTVGYGDFTPSTPLSRGLVVSQLLSGLGLLALLFPLVISRFADFE
jgi:hypothetical protein